MTEFTPTERRVASNSTKLQKVEEAIREAEMGIDKFLDAWEDICSLSEVYGIRSVARRLRGR